MEKSLGKKGLVIGLAAIFLTIAIMPAMGSINHEKAAIKQDIYKEGYEDEKKEMIQVTVTKYSPDGAITSKQISLEVKEAIELKTRLYTTTKMEERYSLLKKYQLVPLDTTLEDLKIGMYELLSSNGITLQTLMKDISSLEESMKLKLPIMLTLLSHIDAVYLIGNSLRVGCTPVTMALNRLFGWNVKGIDLVDVCWGTLGIINARGMLGTHAFVCMPSYMFMAGFVGYAVKFPLSYHIFSGYAVATLAVGMGIHEFQPATT
jgi:hypothetical protein